MRHQKLIPASLCLIIFAQGFYLALMIVFVLSVLHSPFRRPPRPLLLTVVENWQASAPKLPPKKLVPAVTVASGKSSPALVNPLRGAKLYRDPQSAALAQATAWRVERPADASLLDKIASQPTAVWLGDWTSDIKAEASRITSAAAAQNALPVLVAYNLPQRDCGGYSGGGATSAAAYKSWIQALALGIGNRQAVVILEPDSLGVIDCLSAPQLATRYSLLASAVQTLAASPNTFVYIDAGHAGWLSATDMASRLRQAGIAMATGFALNVSNFFPNDVNTNYGHDISKLIGGKHFVIDSSRNGLGSDSTWCNPPGRALGTPPQVGSGLLDAYLWIKTPGESDGTCNGGPPAGTFWPDYALDLSSRAAY